jgi:hypothetical protein
VPARLWTRFPFRWPGKRVQVVLTRTGGVAGLRRQWTVETEHQPNPEHWTRLAGSLPWTGAGGTATSASTTDQRPDQFVYRLRCDNREISLAESQLTGAWREFADLVITAQPPPPPSPPSHAP